MTKYFYTGGGANRSQKEIDILNKKYDLFNKSYIKKIFNKVLGLNVKSYEVPKSAGLPHLIFIVKFDNHKDLVLRSNLGYGKPEQTLLIEKLITDEVLSAGIPSNKILYVDISRKKYPFDFQIQEKIEGLDPEIKFNGTQKDYDKISYELGQIIAKMSEIKFEKFGHFNGKSAIKKNNLLGSFNSFFDYINFTLLDQLKFISKTGHLSINNIDKIYNLFDENKKLININQARLVHYDLADHNLRYDPKNFKITALFDWEAAIAGDPILDLASSPTWKSLFDRESKLIEGYKSLIKLPNNFQLKMDLYRLRTIIWKVEHNIRFKILNAPRLERLAKALEPFKIDPVK